MSTLHYLAYGSNLHPLRLRERVPSAQLQGVVELPRMGLRFHKRGADLSGKCDLVRVPNGDLSYGAVYTLAEAEKHLLDQVEGLGAGYEQTWIDTRLNGGHCRAFAYAASASHIDQSLLPYCWYRQLVLAGARYLSLPEAYIDAIATVQATADPDPQRDAAHDQLLRRMAAYRS